jgi:hypothetical protein
MQGERIEVVQSEVVRMLRAVPFRPFVLNMENGDRVLVEHPENIAFNPPKNGSPGSSRFHVITSNDAVVVGSFAAVTNITQVDEGQSS